MKKNNVALRKESVDRNCSKGGACMGQRKSLSARRAWIEMDGSGAWDADVSGRSPQGERG